MFLIQLKWPIFKEETKQPFSTKKSSKLPKGEIIDHQTFS